METQSRVRLLAPRPLVALLSLVATLALAAFLALSYTPVRAAPSAVDTCAAPLGPKLAEPFTTTYSICDLGSFSTAPNGTHGIAFKSDDPNTLLVEGNSGAGEKLYAVPVTRDAENHITALSSTVSIFADNNPYQGPAVVYGPGNVLFYTRWPQNEVGQYMPGSTIPDSVQGLNALGVETWVTGLNFVPAGFPHAGDLKLMSAKQGDNKSYWYDATFAPDGVGTYNITSATLVTNTLPTSEQFMYVMPGSPLFTDYHTVLASEWSPARVDAYTTDDNGDPIVDTGQPFITGLGAASSQAIDPVTGDVIFSGGGASHFVVVRGFAVPIKPSNDRADLTISESLYAPLRTRNLRFDLKIRNQGPDSAANAAISDTIPAALQFLAATSSVGQDCNFSAETRKLDCPLGDLPAGGTALVSITAGIAAADPSTDCAEAVSATIDPDPTTNSACVSFDPNGADLTLTGTGKYVKMKDGSPAAELDYAVVNNGPGAAFASTVTAVLPAELEYAGMGRGGSYGGGGKSGSVKCSFASDTRTLTCHLFDLRAGQRVPFGILVRALAGTQQAELCAQASSSSPDWDPSDNEACPKVYLVGANLQLTKTNLFLRTVTGKDPYPRIRYDLTLVNDGPETAVNVVLSDTLPAEVELLPSRFPKTCYYDSNTRKLSCQFLSMPVHRVFHLQFYTRPTAGTTPVTNCAEATSDTLDLETTSNQSCATVHRSGVDLSLTQAARAVPKANGVEIVLTLANAGPDTAANLVVSDTVPSGLTFSRGKLVSTSRSKSQPDGTCSYTPETRVFACQLKSLRPGEGAAAILDTIVATPNPTIANCAGVASATEDYDLSNNDSCALLVLKTGKATPINSASSRSQDSMSSPGALMLPSDTYALLEPLRTFLALPLP